MKTDTLKKHLSETVVRHMELTFDDLLSLNQNHWFEGIGLPSEDLNADFCQIEIQLLCQYFDGETEVLQLLAVADDGFHEVGADFFISNDGRYRWDHGVYDIINGVPSRT